MKYQIYQFLMNRVQNIKYICLKCINILNHWYDVLKDKQTNACIVPESEQ